MKRIVSIASAAALATFASNALPAQGSAWDHLREKYDADGDGKVAASEYPRGADKFERFDRDGDGFLTEADFERRGRAGRGQAAGRGQGGRGQAGRGGRGGGRGGQGGRPPGGREAAGRGGRGGGTSRWASMMAPELGKAADLDRDGSIPPGEWKTFLASVKADQHGVVQPSNLPFLKGEGRMLNMATRMFDLDGDGDITTDDLGAMFAMMDENEDGTLQREELGDLPIPGDEAPTFVLPFADDKSKTVDLASFKGKKPVGLIFGSYT